MSDGRKGVEPDGSESWYIVRRRRCRKRCRRRFSVVEGVVEIVVPVVWWNREVGLLPVVESSRRSRVVGELRKWKRQKL